MNSSILDRRVPVFTLISMYSAGLKKTTGLLSSLTHKQRNDTPHRARPRISRTRGHDQGILKRFSKLSAVRLTLCGCRTEMAGDQSDPPVITVIRRDINTRRARG
ncbi:hypothetical protein C0Q70_17194 [Pomacea canaliculata]|uniref:Uncharacterized protein n=1 Tax=Pomacea canaliculata TaxID=400727 RepID=A0A2T7NRY4_POMCA|nr:hypothetical protein C0Q70_17194 [Pomacea canaliculata]